MISIPGGLVRATSRREGEAGRHWLAALPALIARLVDSWGCEIAGEAWNGEVAIALPVRRGAEPAVLKISFPHPAARGEALALRHFRGRGTVRLLDADEAACALLLERAGPETLASVPSADEAIEIAGGLARRLAVPAPAEAGSLAEAARTWGEQLDRQAAAAPGLLPPTAVERARETVALLAGDTTSTMVHGDLHSGNVLAAAREDWLAIDPKGLRGSAAFDAFTVVAERSAELGRSQDAARRRIRRYAAAAGVDAHLAEACCQARAASAYLHQCLQDGDWFDRDLLRTLTDLGQ